MSSLDILFWLLIALLGGVAWAIEAGLTMRHRNMLLASTLSAFGSVVFVMFWIPDESVLELGARPGPIKRQAGSGERGAFEYEDVQKKNNGEEREQKEEDKEDNERPEYSKEPFRDCPHCPEVVIITPKKGDEDDLVKPYAVGRLEVIRQEFQAFVKATNYAANESCDIESTRKGKYSWRNPGFEQDPRHPVVCVSAVDAEAYVKWLKRASAGRTYRLLTQDEWEFAARGRTATPYWQGTAIMTSEANFGRSRDGTIPGGSMLANPFGLSDVNGNAAELLSTCKPSPAITPPLDLGITPCVERLVAGGAWNSTAEQLRIGHVMSIPSTTAKNFVGFRVGRDVDDKDQAKILSKATKASIAADERAAALITAKERADAAKAEYERIEAEAKAAAEPPKKKED